MRSSGTNHESTPSHETVLDAYFTEAAKGPEHRKRIAMQMWRILSPAEQVIRQQEARIIAGSNLALGAEYTQDVLVLEYVNRQASSLQYTPAPRTCEAADPTTSGDAASARPPAA